MSNVFDLEEGFIIRECDITTLKPLIEDWLKANDFTIHQPTTPNMIRADRKQRIRGMRPKIRLFHLSLKQEKGNTIISIKIKGFKDKNKYDYWTILIRLFTYLQNKTDNVSIEEILRYLMNDDYLQYLKIQGKVLIK